MPIETLTALVGIFLAAAWTPGPNNAMLAASGATFGMRRTLPHILGVILGFSLMIFLVGLGLGTAFERSEMLRDALRYGGIGLLIWVAWKIATMKPPGSAGARGVPFTFLQAAGFQWINPKAWAMSISIVSQFVSGDAALREGAIVAAVSVATGITSTFGWSGFGVLMQRVLADPARLRAFNIAMAAMILLGVVYLL